MAITTPDAIDRDTANVVREAQNLLKTIEEKGSDALSDAGTRMQDTIDKARRNLGHAEQVAIDSGKRAIATADNYVHGNPWQAVGLGAAIGLLAGLLLSRR